jgi:hyaluronan synthase
MAKWLKQQVRWARATHIESLLQPQVYANSHPLLFYGMAKREFGPVIAAAAVLYYFVTSTQLIDFSFADIGLRICLAILYNMLRNPDRLRGNARLWVLPGMFFYYIPLPAIHVWSMLTLTADGWGTSMRADGEQARKSSSRKAWFETGFFVVWMGIVAGTATRWLSAYLELGWGQETTAVALGVSVASIAAWRTTIGAS